MVSTDIDKIQTIVVSKLVHREFDEEFDHVLSLYMRGGTILGNLARLSKKINSKKKQISSRFEFSEWQFGSNDHE